MDENCKKISVIIPVYNTKEELEICLDSICRQTYRNLEIICVDDGSTDGSSEIVDKYARKDNRVLAIHQPNAGESAARNRGLVLATGEYIAFVDCDDWLDINMYQQLVTEIEKYDSDVAATGWIKEYVDRSIPAKNKKSVKEGALSRRDMMEYVYERDSYQGFAYIWDKLYRRRALIKPDGTRILFDESLKLGGDILFLGSVVLNLHTAVYIDEALYHYRQREDSGCHKADIEGRVDWLKSYQILIEKYESADIDENIVALLKRFLVYHSGNAVQMAWQQKDYEKLEYFKDIINQYLKEYKETNAHHPERIAWIDDMLMLGRTVNEVEQ